MAAKPERCSECAYGILCADGKIKCHFMPPTVLSAPQGARGGQAWPNMKPTDFCGQFKEKKTT